MGLRPGHCYSKNTGKRAYTRVAKRVHRKNFVGGVPGLRIRQFHMGTGAGKYSHVVHYVTKERIQIRDNALEASRITIVRQLNKLLTAQNYYMKLRVYPQFFLRENKQAQGAHADRIQQGMSQCPFGKVVGRASRVRPNQKIFSILVNEANIPIVRKILKKVGSKLPSKMGIIVEENKDSLKSVGTTKRKRRVVAKVKTTEESEGNSEIDKVAKKVVSSDKDSKKAVSTDKKGSKKEGK